MQKPTYCNHDNYSVLLNPHHDLFPKQTLTKHFHNVKQIHFSTGISFNRWETVPFCWYRQKKQKMLLCALSERLDTLCILSFKIGRTCCSLNALQANTQWHGALCVGLSHPGLPDTRRLSRKAAIWTQSPEQSRIMQRSMMWMMFPPLYIKSRPPKWHYMFLWNGCKSQGAAL